MNRATYTLPLTGKEIEKKLALLDGNNEQVNINADKISVLSATKSTDDELTLATKGYVDNKIGTGNTGVPENLPQPDWNQNDETSPDYIKNRTHYETLATKLVYPISEDRDDPLACWSEGEAVGTKQKVGLLNDMYGHTFYGDELITEDNCGKTYRITSSKLLGNVTFEGVLKQGAKTTTEDYYYIGNPAYAQSAKSGLPTEDSGENFCVVAIRYHESAGMPYPGSLWIWAESDTTVMDPSILTDGFVSVRIEHIYQEVKTLDEKYIPDTIAKAEHNHRFKDIVDSAYDDSSKWKEITNLLNQHVYGDLTVVTPANGCPGNGGTSGLGYRVCDCCGHKKVEQIKPQHFFDQYVSVDGGHHDLSCSSCGELLGNPVECIAAEDWYTDDESLIAWQKCATCENIINEHTHLYIEEIDSYDNCGIGGCPYAALSKVPF